MKLESQITNNHSSLIDNQSKKRSTTVENSLQITPFYAKQTQFLKYQMNINTIITISYGISDTLTGQKTKPKQTQLKPIQTQFKAKKQSQNKPNLSKGQK